MVIALIGGAGSGKDTQARMLAQRYHIPAVSTGQIIRDGARKGNPLALEAQALSSRGIWPSDELINMLLSNHIDNNCENGFIVTGYPRTITQAHTLPSVLSRFGLQLDLVVHILVPDEVLLERMKIQAKEAEAAGNPRDDTHPEVMQQRLNSYHSSIDPILKFYRPQGILAEVDGMPGKEEVNDSIVIKIQEMKERKEQAEREHNGHN